MNDNKRDGDKRRPISKSYPFEVGCRLDLAYGLHESVSDNYRNVRARVSIRLLSESHKIGLGEAVGSRSQMEFEHEAASVLLWQRDVDPLLKSAQSVMEQSTQERCSRNPPEPSTYRLLMAESRVHGMFVAPSTSTPSLSFPTPVNQNAPGKYTPEDLKGRAASLLLGEISKNCPWSLVKQSWSSGFRNLRHQVGAGHTSVTSEWV